MTPDDTRTMVMHSTDDEITYLGVQYNRSPDPRHTGIRDDHRNKHVLVTGATGEGKTQATIHAVTADIAKGRGVCIAGPKGDFINDVLARIPDDRMDDVIYLNPRYNPGLNVLEPVAPDRLPDTVLENQKELITDEIIQLFKRRSEHWGDRFGHVLTTLLRTHIDLNVAHGASNTLMDVYQCVRDNDRVNDLIAKIDDPIQRHDLEFITELSQSDLAPLAYRLREFVGNETIRSMVASPTSTVDFRDAVDTGNIVIVEVQKGEVGADVARITVSIVLAKIWSAIQSRFTQPPEDREPFHVYIDEFQNFSDEESLLSTMVAEGREYKLGVWLVTQLLSRSEISASLRETVLTNCQSKLVFRPEGEDARILENALSGVDRDQLDGLNSYTAFLQTPGTGDHPPAKRVETYPPWNPDRSRSEIEALKTELAETTASGPVATGSQPSDTAATGDTGASVTAGGDMHEEFLAVARRRLEELPEVDRVNLLEQREGVSMQDGTVFFEDGSKAYLEAELTSLSKPANVLRNLQRAAETGVECIFVIEDGDRDRLERIVEDPVNRSGTSHEDANGSFDYYQDGSGAFTDTEAIDDAAYRILEVSPMEIEEIRDAIEAECPELGNYAKERLRMECMARTEDGRCEKLGKPCVLIDQ